MQMTLLYLAVGSIFVNARTNVESDGKQVVTSLLRGDEVVPMRSALTVEEGNGSVTVAVPQLTTTESSSSTIKCTTAYKFLETLCRVQENTLQFPTCAGGAVTLDKNTGEKRGDNALQ